MPAGKSKKAPNGAGSIRKVTKEKNGKKYEYYEGRITTGINADGTQQRRYVSGKTQAEVRKTMTELMQQVDTGCYLQPDKTTLEQWCAIWVETYLDNVQDSSRHTYQQHLNNYILPSLGKAQLQSIKKVHVQTFVNTIKKKLSPKTLHDVHGVLHHIMEDALDAEMISKNPCRNIMLPKIEDPDLVLPSIAGVTNLLKAVQTNRFANMFEADLLTGLRQGELLGLTWSQIQLERGMIHVDRQLTYDRSDSSKRYIKLPKYEKIRDVPITPAFLNVLERQKIVVKDLREAAGDKWIERDLVFPNLNGDWLPRQTVYCNFVKLVMQAGLEGMRFHDMRHVFAMLSITGGVDVSTVQNALGHATPEFTLKVYAYVNDDTNRAAAKKMQGAFEILFPTSVNSSEHTSEAI